jgi:hypothetical protein
MNPPAALLRKLIDAHCHPTDTWPISDAEADKCPMRLCAMSTGLDDQVVRTFSVSTNTRLVHLLMLESCRL